jgi:hypothetical protein
MKNMSTRFKVRCRTRTLNIGDRKGICMDHQYSVVEYLVLWFRLKISNQSFTEKEYELNEAK